jgi:sugar O-acyltransferase (sialic acid O-acetyltransferase NeuD family)
MNKLVLVGAGGQGREVVQLIRDINRIKPTWEIVGFLDDTLTKIGQYVLDIMVIGTIDQINKLVDADTYIFCSIGQSEQREHVINTIRSSGINYKVATLIHPTAVVADDVQINEGSQISALTVISTNVICSSYVLINYGSTIGHDSIIGEFTTISPGCRISGHVNIGARSEIGTGCNIIQSISIGSSCVIGAGAVVIVDLPDKCTAVGVPARIISYRE